MWVSTSAACLFILEKIGHTTSTQVQSEILMLVEKFLRHNMAVDLEGLLDALQLAQLSSESSLSCSGWTLMARERLVRNNWTGMNHQMCQNSFLKNLVPAAGMSCAYSYSMHEAVPVTDRQHVMIVP